MIWPQARSWRITDCGAEISVVERLRYRDLPYPNAFPLPTKVRGAARENKFQETDSRAYLGSKTVQRMGGSSDIKIEQAIREGCQRATLDHPFRSSICNPITRKTTSDSTGVRIPIVEFSFLPDVDYLEILMMPKGSGSENMILLKKSVSEKTKIFFAHKYPTITFLSLTNHFRSPYFS